MLWIFPPHKTWAFVEMSSGTLIFALGPVLPLILTS